MKGSKTASVDPAEYEVTKFGRRRKPVYRRSGAILGASAAAAIVVGGLLWIMLG